MPNPESGISYTVPGLEGLAPLDAKPLSLTELVYDSIRTSIVKKRLAPGTPVAEVSLASRLKVSKTPVREALLRLQVIGLVEPDGSRGLRVVMPSEQGISHAYEVRRVLESGLARQAAGRASDEQRQEILVAAQRSLACAEAGDIARGFKTSDRLFHRAVGAAGGNPRLAQLAEDAAALASVLRERDVPDIQDAIQCGRRHMEIAEAIGRGDPGGAAAGSEGHVDDVIEMVLTAYRERYG